MDDLRFLTNTSVIIGIITGFIVVFTLTLISKFALISYKEKRFVKLRLSLFAHFGYIIVAVIFGYFFGGLIGVLTGSRFTEMYGPILGYIGGNIGGVIGGIFGGSIKLDKE